MKLSHVILLCLVSGSFLQAQSLEKTYSFDLGYRPTAASIDRQGYLYFSNNQGAIDKLDKKGNEIYHYSPQKQGTPTLIDAWQGLRTFVYYQNFQEYILLDRFLNASERYQVNSNQISDFSGLATLANDNNLWILNNQELSLKKIDINDRELLIENQLNLSLDIDSWDIKFIRSYQNYLFIGDSKEGIFVFDNLGNYSEKITESGIDFFTFTGDEIVFLSSGKLQMIHLYDKTKREISLPDLPYQFVLMENNQIFLVHNQTVEVYNLN
ncbi:hypothetical protein BFP97_09840 [Roseivirga sp. 4D4]|uniref:hypothetical protein n=1 Tax=Roseivirga sp. 4D4 TaxID=1889784 RepID=UPI000852FFEF|nr:hypothetical protein [Roseivirga sp. 4D4]OEK01798.1 hypothetical protein BFP97_09840 [Roseivirga sp. 4D4]